MNASILFKRGGFALGCIGAAVLADARLSADDRAELRELLRIVASRWRAGAASPA